MHCRRIALACALFCLATFPASAVPQYTLQDLGTLTPGGAAQPQGINQAGQVFGSTGPGTGTGPIFFWSPQGGMIGIGALADAGLPVPATGGPESAAAMNDHGQIIGVSQVNVSGPGSEQFSGVNHAFLWTPASDDKSGVIQDIGTLGTPSVADLGTTAVAINNNGQVIGTADALTLTTQGYLNINPAHGFLWTPGGTNGIPFNPQMQDLGFMQPALLDDKGNVIGLLNDAITLYTGSQFISLGDPPGFDPTNVFNPESIILARIDATGDIYGVYSTQGENTSTPFAWIPSQPGATTGRFVVGNPGTDLPPPGALTDAELPMDAQILSINSSLSATVFAFDPQNAA